MSALSVRHRHRSRRVHTPLLRRLLRALLKDALRVEDFEICFHLVAAPEMAGLNARFLQHQGSTDVITFDYTEKTEPTHQPLPGGGASLPTGRDLPTPRLHGEIFICLDDAVLQARQFRTTWPEELVRYAVHGVLHLLGYDDARPEPRRRMKRAETRLTRHLARRFALSALARAPKLAT